MTATYSELLKKSYIQRLRNSKVSTGNDILLQLERISEDYLKEISTADALATLNDNLTSVL
jgi:hypothetical protein